MIDIDAIIKKKTDEGDKSMPEKDENQEEIKENETNNALIETKENSSKSLMENITAPKVNPEIDKEKDIIDQAEDVVKFMGAQKASTDEEFMDTVAQNFQKGVLSDQEVKNMKRQRLLEQEYYLKWEDVLNFAFIKSPHGLTFMEIMTVIAMIVYVPLRMIGMFFKSVGTLFDFMNDIFNSIFFII